MPQSASRHSLFAAALACLLLALPAPGAAATTRACLQEGIAKCAAAGDADGRLACLDEHLAGCRGWCPDVATPCARRKLEKSSAEAWRDPLRLAGAAAEGCFMDVNCPPPPKQRPTPPPKVVLP